MTKRIGIYGGSFDPVHLGHLNLAAEAMEKGGLDEVWFCPAFINPLKVHKSKPASPEHRKKMLELAIEGQPCFRVIDIELKRQEPSFTIETLQALLASQDPLNPRSFTLILGDDAIESFCHWRQPEEIVKLVPLFIGTRCAFLPHIQDLPMSPFLQKVIEEAMVPTRVMQICSQEVRERLSKKMYCGHLLQAKVLDYIHANQLYY